MDRIRSYSPPPLPSSPSPLHPSESVSRVKCCRTAAPSSANAGRQPDDPVLPLLSVDQRHGLEAGAVLDLAGDGLRALDAALGHVEGDVDAGGDGARHKADGELPQELQRGVLAGGGKG